MRGTVLELLYLVDRFFEGEDTSQQNVDQITAILLENFNDEEWFDDIIVPLTQYTPGGGQYMYDEADLASELNSFRKILEGLLIENGGSP